MPTLTKTCIVCGTAFATRGRAPQREKFCSKKCNAKHWNRRAWEKRRPPDSIRQRMCVICSRSFMAPVFRPNALTCSQPCNAQRQNRRRQELKLRHWRPSEETRHCSQCGSAFSPKKYGGRRQRFCTADCRERWNQHRYVERHGQAELTQRSRKRKWGGNWLAALDRDGHRCINCQATVKYPHVHHIDGTGETESPNHDLSNLATLCGACHALMHAMAYRVVGDRLFIKAPAFKLLGWPEEVSTEIAHLSI